MIWAVLPEIKAMMMMMMMQTLTQSQNVLVRV